VTRRRDYSANDTASSSRNLQEPTCDLDSHVELELGLVGHLGDRIDLVVGAFAIAFDDKTVVEAAAASGLTRFQLTRQLARALDPEMLAA